MKHAELLLRKEHGGSLTHQSVEVIAPPEEGAAATAMTKIQRRINTHDAEAAADLDNASGDSP